MPNWKDTYSRYGDVEHVYGRFHLRPRLPIAGVGGMNLLPLVGLFLVLGPGDEVNGFREGDEVPLATISPDKSNVRDVRDVLCHVRVTLERDQQVLARQRERVTQLRAEAAAPNAAVDELGRAEDERTMSFAEEIADEQERIRVEQDRSDAAERAIAELEALHPDIDVTAYLPAYREKLKHPPTEQALAERKRREKEWWHQPEQGVEWAWPHVLGDMVARYGAFSVYEVFLVVPDGSRRILPPYEVHIDGVDAPVLAAPLGTPVTPYSDRATTITFVGMWLRLLGESIKLGYQALNETHDAALSTTIHNGLRRREEQYQHVERALRELQP
jgi:hypothetical protein